MRLDGASSLKPLLAPDHAPGVYATDASIPSTSELVKPPVDDEGQSSLLYRTSIIDRDDVGLTPSPDFFNTKSKE